MTRNGEVKLGEVMQLIDPAPPLKQALLASKATYIVFGVPEDIGVQANLGKIGTRSTWIEVRNALCNIPLNNFLKTNDIAVLGHLDTKSYYQRLENTVYTDNDVVETLRSLTSSIDELVTELIATIITCGKIPIIIGGGHNNAYGAMKGTAKALGHSINVINLDAHTDLRHLEGRHSGNPFSYAMNDAILNKYAILGVQEAFTPQYIWEIIDRNADNVFCQTYDAIGVRSEATFQWALNAALDFVNDTPFGVELDVDVIADFPSSARSITGWSVEQARQYINLAGQQSNARYLHICEAIVDPQDDTKWVKALVLFILDFCKARKQN